MPLSAAPLSSVTHHHRHLLIVEFIVMFSAGVDSFHFRAVWTISTRLLSVTSCCLTSGRCSYFVSRRLPDPCMLAGALRDNAMQQQVGTPARSGAGRAVSGIESQ